MTWPEALASIGEFIEGTYNQSGSIRRSATGRRRSSNADSIVTSLL